MKRNCVYCVICLALLAWAVSNGNAETKKSTGPTITVENMTFPAYPEGCEKLKDQIDEIKNRIQVLKNGETEVNSQGQQVRKASLNLLSEETQNRLREKITENPDLKVYDVKSLCPNNMSFKTFAKIVKALKEMPGLEEELKKLESKLQAKADVHIITIADKIISKHPDYNTFEAKFPFDDLISGLSDLHEAMAPYYDGKYSEEKKLFDVAEGMVWGSRPCVLNSEPAQIALKFWTAFMRGDYDEAEKYTAGENLAELIKKAKTNPESRKGRPINPNYVGTILLGTYGEKYFFDGQLIFFILPGKLEKTDIGSRMLKLSQLENQDDETLLGFGFIGLQKDENGAWKVIMNK